MTQYNYKVVPAPQKGLKAKGARTGADRFAYALQLIMNAQAAEGWEYQRTDTLPSQEREGLMGKATIFQNMMVFRRKTTLAEHTPENLEQALLEDMTDDDTEAQKQLDPMVANAPQSDTRDNVPASGVHASANGTDTQDEADAQDADHTDNKPA